MTDVSADVHARVRGLSDEEFFSMLLRSVDARVVHGTTFPSFPDDQLQANFVGSSGKDALNEAYNFWRVLKSKASALGRPLGETSNVLDFGCGWGRYLRFLNKDTRADHLHGRGRQSRDRGPMQEAWRGWKFESDRTAGVASVP